MKNWSLAYDKNGGPEQLYELEGEIPSPGPRDLLVEVRASGLNPADPKIRGGLRLQGPGPQVLGFDAAGVVQAVGAQVEDFEPGDSVYYAGAVDRPGSNARLQVVDERIVGPKPKSLDFEEAAALPLTSLTAWELLFDRLGFDSRSKGSLLLLGAAGGVGSMVIQLAKKMTELQVVATASRAESQAWVRELGADSVLDHRADLLEQARTLGLDSVVAAIGINGVDAQQAALAELIRPQGKLGLVDDPQAFDIYHLKLKSISLHWEFMFTRSLFRTEDMDRQGKILRRVSEAVDTGEIRTTLKERLGPLSLKGLREAHERIITSTSLGKLVFSIA
ncbi:MAG: zinc-binding alcohol dehydrogenase family protein [Myxococcota bacterium]